MTHLHLNEEDVQLVAMDKPVVADPTWRDCPDCRERVEAYRIVFSSLSGLEPEKPGFDLEAAVMSSLPERVLPKPMAPQPMFSAPIWIGSAAFLGVLGVVAIVLRSYLGLLTNWVTGLVLVTVPGIAIWLLIDTVQDHHRKLRSIGLS
jgi:hypothetical protein